MNLNHFVSDVVKLHFAFCVIFIFSLCFASFSDLLYLSVEVKLFVVNYQYLVHGQYGSSFFFSETFRVSFPDRFEVL